jgi:hypothetical protein
MAVRVRAIFSFGGYYDVFRYLSAIATRTTECGGRPVAWHADQGAIAHIRDILREQRATHLLSVFEARTREEVDQILDAAPEREIGALQAANPADRVDKLRARIFILHDKGDRYVPYCESLKLDEALGSWVEKRLLIVGLFEHTQPRSALTRATAGGFARLLWFLATAFDYL